MKSYKTPVKCILFLALLGLCLWLLGGLLKYKESDEQKAPLLKSDEEADVLLCGSSHMQDNIYPITLWKDFGITSYNVAGSGEELEVTYYVLKELLKSKSPKAVVVDVFRLHNREQGFDENAGLIHGSMDFMPFSQDKAELAEKAAKAHDTNPISFLSSLYAYHSRWKELTEEDFEPDYNREKGAVLLSGIYEHERPVFYPDSFDEEKLTGTGYEYMKKINNLCQDKNITCIFVNIPYTGVTKARETIKNTCLREIEKEGALVLDMNSHIDEMGIDYSFDYRDDDGHFNLVGAKKATDFLGEYLQREAGLEDHRMDEEIAESWQEAVSVSDEHRLDLAREATNAVSYVMCGYEMDDWDISVYISPNVKDKKLPDSILDRVCRELSVPVKTLDEEAAERLLSDRGEEELSDNEVYIIIKNRDSGEYLDSALFEYKAQQYSKQ